MTSWHSYTEIYSVGHRAVQDIFKEDIIIEEKVDGSQLSFGLIDGELKIRSKGREFDIYAADMMFQAAAGTVLSLKDKLHPNWTYRGEYLNKPKHNALAYDRTPNKNIIIFDINTDEEQYLLPEEKKQEANRLGLETVPMLWAGAVDEIGIIRTLLGTKSVLGGQLIEGVVIKNYNRFNVQKKALMAKYVSESFKEVHRQNWKSDNPSPTDVILRLVEEFKTQARWNKAIQHLKENGQLLDDPKDIGPLMKEINDDVLKECADEIKEKLFMYAWKHISRNLTRGFPEYYKEYLLKQQFGTEPNMEKVIEEVRDKSILREAIDKAKREDEEEAKEKSEGEN